MPIKNVEITTKLNDVAALIQDSKSWAAIQPNTSLDAHLATYIDVCLLGVLEESIELLFRERAGRSGDKYTANYICDDLDHFFQNPKQGKIVEVLAKFDHNLASAFGAKFPANCSEMTALRDINSIKQNLAHLGAYNLNLTIGDIEDYFNRVIPILEAIETSLA
ncbi:MAG: hypothetical protein V1767_01255 [Chloroflexota bacterium]